MIFGKNESGRQSRRVLLNRTAGDVPEFFISSLQHCRFMSGPDMKITAPAFCRIERFRMPGGDTDAELIEGAMRSAVETSEDSCVVGICFDGSEAAVFWGAPENKIDDVRACLAGNLADLSVTTVATDTMRWKRFTHGGAFQGFCAGRFNWAAMCRSFRAQRGIVACFVKKVDEEQLRSERRQLELLKADLTESSMEIGSVQNQRNFRPNPVVSAAVPFVEFHSERLAEGIGESTYLVSLCCAAEDAQTEKKLASAVRGAFVPEHGEKERCCRKLNYVSFDDGLNPFVSDDVFLPVHRLADNQLNSRLPLLSNQLCEALCSSQIVSVLPVPFDSVPGFHVSVIGRDATSFDEFDLIAHTADPDEAVEIGTIESTGQKESISLSQMKQHVSVFGATGSGKSTTLRKLALAADRRGVGCIFLEPIKGEFTGMPDFGMECEIFSSGRSGRKLIFNPFIPEELTTIIDHAKSLVISLVSAGDSEAPIPQALQMLVMDAYLKHGWKPTDTVFEGDSRTFPTFREVFDNIGPFFRSQNLYSGEVKTNVLSALTVRLSALKDFEFLNGDQKLPTEQFFSKNTIIQFDGISHKEDKCFFGNMLLTNFDEYVRNRDSASCLKNLIFIDESHNFFKRECPREAGRSSLSEVSRHFSDMLSEIRSYGVGIVVADQRPSAMSRSVIANTAVKIVHALEDSEDIGDVSECLGLSDYQKALYHSLIPGEAIVSVRGERAIVKVKVEQTAKVSEVIGMCRFCASRHRCVKTRAQEAMGAVPAKMFAQLMRRSICDADSLMQLCSGMFREAGVSEPAVMRCLAGHVVELVEGIKYREYLNSVLDERLQ